jgi:hypothetical protein
MAGTYSAVVKGSYGTLPRGFPWIFLLWYAGMAAAYGFGAGFGFTSPASVAAFAAFTVGAILVTYIVGNAKPRAFAADAEGIWLGVRRKEPWQDRRKRAHIPWAQIQEIRISPTPAGRPWTSSCLLLVRIPGRGSGQRPRRVPWRSCRLPRTSSGQPSWSR